MKFEKPELTVVSFDAADVVCTSGVAPQSTGFSFVWSTTTHAAGDDTFSVTASDFTE